MNHFYRVIFNQSLGEWQCVSEQITTRNKSSNKSIKTLVLAMAMINTGTVMADTNIESSQHIYEDATLTDHINISRKKSLDGDFLNRDYAVTLYVDNSNVSVIAKGTPNQPKGIVVGTVRPGSLKIRDNATLNVTDSVILGLESEPNATHGNYGRGDIELVSNSTLKVGQLLQVGGETGTGKGFFTAEKSNISANTLTINDGSMFLDDSSKASITNSVILANAISGVSSDLSITNNSVLTAKDLIIGKGHNSSNSNSSGDSVATVCATNSSIVVDKVLIGQNTTGKLHLDTSTLNAKQITMGGTANKPITSSPIRNELHSTDSHIITTNISRSHNPNQSESSSKISMTLGRTKLTLTQDTELFSNFNSNDYIEFGDVHIDTNGRQINVNPNARIQHSYSSSLAYDSTLPFKLDTQKGLHKVGKGTLTFHSNNLNFEENSLQKSYNNDFIIHEGQVKIHGDYVIKDNQGIHLKLNNLQDYGQFIVSGHLNISEGELNVYAADAIKQLLSQNNPNTEWKDVIKAGQLTGKFNNFKVLDNQGQEIQSTLKTQYDSNAVHLTTKPVHTTTSPTTNTTSPTTNTTSPTTNTTSPTTNTTSPTTNTTSPTTNTTSPTQPSLPSRIRKFSDSVKSSNQPNAQTIAKQLDLALNDKTQGLGKTLNALQQFDNLATDANKQLKFVEQLQPEIHTQAPQIIQKQYNITTSAITERVFQSRADATQGSDSDDLHSLFKRSQNINNQVWLQGIGKELKTENNTNGYKGHAHGAVVGVDGLVSDNLRIGTALGYSDSDIDTIERKQNLQTKLLQGYIYADYSSDDNVHLNGFVSYGQAKVNTERNLNLNNLVTSQAKVDYNGNITQAGIGTDYRIGSLQQHISPYVQLNYTRIKHDAYQEKVTDNAGNLNDLGQTISGNAHEQLHATVGIHFAQPLGNYIQAVGHVAGHAEQSDNNVINASFNGLPNVNFTQTAQEKDKYSSSAGLGLRFQPNMNTEISGQYHGEFSKYTENHGGALMIKFKF